MTQSQIPASHVDVLVVGAGPVGGAFALALDGAGLQVMVVDARSEAACLAYTGQADPRALAVSHRACSQLAAWGVTLPAVSAPIHRVHVSQPGGMGRVLLDRDDLALPELGQVLPYSALAQAVHTRLRTVSDGQKGVAYLTNTFVTDVQTLDAYAAVHMNHQGCTHLVTARLVVLADGGPLLAKLNFPLQIKDYEQHAIVAVIKTDTRHQQTAFERFAEDGPIAFLPRGEDEFSVVWTRPLDDSLDALHLSDAAFLQALQQRMGDRAGRLLAVSGRTSFPLRLKWARRPYARRVAVIGNAAQTLHPVAGQGYNLGLRDAVTLARVIRTCMPSAVGGLVMLRQYADLRRQDSGATIGFTDGLISLFAVDKPRLRWLTPPGFWAIDAIKPLRRAFAERMVFGNG